MKNEPNEPTGNSSPEREEVSTSVPPATLPENKSSAAHTRSHAAHLDEGSSGPRTKPVGDLRKMGSYPTGRKQP